MTLAQVVEYASAPQTFQAPEAMVLDHEVLEDICGDDPPFRAELLGRFGDSCLQLMARLEAAARAGDAKRLGETAHRLKGAALTIGANAFAAALLEVERHGDAGNATRAAEALIPASIACAELRDHLSGMPHRR
jgi:HPt (histidine-containing phosphotransfer) domain-containing protein